MEAPGVEDHDESSEEEDDHIVGAKKACFSMPSPPHSMLHVTITEKTSRPC